MNIHQKRLKAIEVNLTPLQLVLLWTKDAIPGTYVEGAYRSPSPRTVIANSVAQTVRTALRGEPEAVVERGILQARQEADYHTVVELNGQIHSQHCESDREHTFLLGYFAATMGCSLGTFSPEDQVRALTLLFVKPIPLLEAACSRISTERFDGHPILFSDSITKLKEQLEWVDDVFEIFNLIAEKVQFRKLSKEEISDSLNSAIDQEMSHISLLARAKMLLAFGEHEDLRENFNRFLATYSLQERQNDKK